MWLLAFLILAFGYLGRTNIVDVYFQSENFRNVLHWDPLDSPDNQTVVYSVEYNEYGETFKPKRGCQNITALSCDLTEDTPLTKQVDKYAAQVMVGGKRIGETIRFCPFTDSVLGPPYVSVTLNASVMTVRVDLPMGPNSRSLEKILIYPPVYTLILTYNISGETITKEYKSTSAVFTISSLQSGTKYCGSVTYNSGHLKRREPSKASTFCKTLPEDIAEAPFLLLLPVGIILLLLVLIPVLLWRLLIVKKVTKPESLNVTSNACQPLAADEKNISRIELQPEKATMVDEKLGFTDKKKQSTGYAPQNTLAEPWHCQTYTTQQAAPPEESDSSAQSSPNYCLVMVHNSSKDENSPVIGSPGGGNFSMSDQPLAPVTDLHQICEAASGGPDSPELETLRLQISPDGRLKLPFLYQPSGLNGDCDPDEETSERKALLADLSEAKGAQGLRPELSTLIVYQAQEVSETCATNTYISNQVVPPSPQGPTSYLPIQPHFCPLPIASGTQSTYRQNWVPPIVPESSTGSRVSLQSTWVNPAERENQEEGVDEEDEEVNAGKGIFFKRMDASNSKLRINQESKH